MDHEFFARNPETVARELIGCELIHERKTELRVRIVETEAYKGPSDPASHAFSGKTERNKPMFGEPGKAYIYLSYGIHYLLNVVTDTEENPSAVLIRAAEPIKGLEKMKENRGVDEKNELCSGPGKLTQALEITKEYNRVDLTDSGLWIEKRRYKREIIKDTRIGISEGKKMELRFYESENPCVSKY